MVRPTTVKGPLPKPKEPGPSTESPYGTSCEGKAPEQGAFIKGEGWEQVGPLLWHKTCGKQTVFLRRRPRDWDKEYKELWCTTCRLVVHELYAKEVVFEEKP